MVGSSKELTQNASGFTPLLDLFQQSRKAGMKLTFEQYDLLRQALEVGDGLADWEDLRDVCRMLWVKPSLNYDAEIFEQVFDQYQADYQRQIGQWLDRQKIRMSLFQVLR